MKIFDTKAIREIDEFTIKNEPVSSIDLMERAAESCCAWIASNCDVKSPINIFTGPGNNGGDGWAIARLLFERGFEKVALYHLQLNPTISTDSESNRDRLLKQGKIPVKYIRSSADFPVVMPTEIIIDALFGSGLSRPLEGLSAELVTYINKSGCRTMAIDIPSGLFGEDNSNNTGEVITASETLTFQFPKRSFFFAENQKYTGKWIVLPIGLHPLILAQLQTDYFYTTSEDIKYKIKKRGTFSHKGTYGHALLIAGSYGMMGAAILAAKACLRTGAGLVTCHIPGMGYPIVQTGVPESIFSLDESGTHFHQCPEIEKYSAVGVGPGIGMHAETNLALEILLKKCRKPLVLDADAINILAENPELLELLNENSILTPHPGEFDRMAGKSADGFSRNQKQIELSRKYKIIIILKGAFSSVSMPDGKCFFNSTGNPGMATAGVGDVLTGIILSLLAQGYVPEEAAIIGTYIHGLAGDIASAEISQESLIASDIINYIGNAYNKIQKNETSNHH